MTRFLVASLSLLLLSGCSDPTQTARYALAPVPAEKHLPNRIGTAELREVSLPQYAAGQEITWQTEDGALRSTPKQIWADDPPRAMTLALAREISALSGATVIAEPWPLSESPQNRVEVRVEEFLPGADGMVRLSGAYYVTPAQGAGRDVVRRFALHQPVVGEGAAALVAAQSAAVAALAAQMAQLK